MGNYKYSKAIPETKLAYVKVKGLVLKHHKYITKKMAQLCLVNGTVLAEMDCSQSGIRRVQKWANELLSELDWADYNITNLKYYGAIKSLSNKVSDYERNNKLNNKLKR